MCFCVGKTAFWVKNVGREGLFGCTVFYQGGFNSKWSVCIAALKKQKPICTKAALKFSFYHSFFQWQLHRACESGGDDAGRLKRRLACSGRGSPEQGGGVPPPSDRPCPRFGLWQVPLPHPRGAPAWQTGKKKNINQVKLSLSTPFVVIILEMTSCFDLAPGDSGLSAEKGPGLHHCNANISPLEGGGQEVWPVLPESSWRQSFRQGGTESHRGLGWRYDELQKLVIQIIAIDLVLMWWPWRKQ